MSAHFDASDNVPLEGDAIEGASAQVPIHAGVGVVAPVELLTHLLANERLVAMRKQTEEEVARTQEAEEIAATADTVVPQGPTEFQRFEDLAHEVISVPKSEVDEKRETT